MLDARVTSAPAEPASTSKLTLPETAVAPLKSEYSTGVPVEQADSLTAVDETSSRTRTTLAPDARHAWAARASWYAGKKENRAGIPRTPNTPLHEIGPARFVRTNDPPHFRGTPLETDRNFPEKPETSPFHQPSSSGSNHRTVVPHHVTHDSARSFAPPPGTLPPHRRRGRLDTCHPRPPRGIAPS